MLPENGRERREGHLGFSGYYWLFAAALVVAVILVYHPAWHGGIIWDDNEHVTKPELRSLHGLYRIWFEVGATQQYYPLLQSAFWVEHRLWGDATLGYHLVNILLHCLAALMVVLILRRLAIPGAFLAAAIFALHPVQVESVAWITEQKNTLSAVFYLSAALAYLCFDQERKRSCYWWALGLFVAALLSKPVTVTLPAALLLVFWWQRGRLSWRRDVLPLAPFFTIGAAYGILTTWFERTLIGAEGTPLHLTLTGRPFDLTLIERCLLAGRAVWFYLGKLLWPSDLLFFYPRWHVSQAVWRQYLFPVAALLLLAFLWKLRLRWRGPLAALLFFAGTLFPLLGFFNVFLFAYTYVADHFQYLASLGMITLASAGVALLLERWGFWWRQGGYVLCLGLLAIMTGLTFRQSRMYTNIETLYRTTLAANPDCWMAHNNLGIILAGSGRIDEAIAQYNEALKIRPDYSQAYTNLGMVLAGHGRVNEAISLYQKAMKINPDCDIFYNNLGIILADHGRVNEAVSLYQKALKINPDCMEAYSNLGNALKGLGRFDEAIAEFRKAVELSPHYATARCNLGNALRGSGRVNEAIAEYQKALEINPDSLQAHNELGYALLRDGQSNEAIAEYRKVLEIKPNFAEAHSNLGNALKSIGRLDEAIAEYRKALKIRPDYAEAHCNLGNALAICGRIDEAIGEFRKALENNPNFAGAHHSLGSALIIDGRVNEAIVEFSKALKIRPDYLQAHYNLGNAMLGCGQFDEAIAHFQEAVKIKPDYGQAHSSLGTALAQREGALKSLAQQRESLRSNPNNSALLNDTAWALATSPNVSLRNGAEAMELAQRAVKLSSGQDPAILATLAAAYAEAGRFSDAVQTARKAANLAALQGKPDMLDSLQTQLPLYEAGTAFHETRHPSANRLP